MFTSLSPYENALLLRIGLAGWQTNRQINMYIRTFLQLALLQKTHFVCFSFLTLEHFSNRFRSLWGVFSSASWTIALLYINISLSHSWVLTHQTHRLTFIGTFLIFITVQHTSVLSTTLCLLHISLFIYWVFGSFDQRVCLSGVNVSVNILWYCVGNLSN